MFQRHVVDAKHVPVQTGLPISLHWNTYDHQHCSKLACYAARLSRGREQNPAERATWWVSKPQTESAIRDLALCQLAGGEGQSPRSRVLFLVVLWQ
jgi:hypothetical protein